MSTTAFDLLRESLERISEMISELPAIASLVLDPVWADDTRLAAASVAIRMSAEHDPEPPENRAYRPMAIHPYPRSLVRPLTRPEERRVRKECVRTGRTR